jgi:hypothetical protein
MNKQLMEIVLPRLARPLYKQLQRYRSGKMNDKQFTKGFEDLLREQHSWLSKQGIPERDAALALHGAVLVLSGPGLRAEAKEAGLPLEVVEYRAIREAANDVAKNYGLEQRHAMRIITGIVAKYAE